MSVWTETFRGAVMASEYDPESSMNSRLYIERFDQATWFLMHTIGVTPRSIRQQGRRVAVVRQNFQYVRELRGGELVRIESGFIAVGRKHLRFLHRMFDVESGALIATSDVTAVQASLETGTTVALPDDQTAKAQERTITDAEID
ncbi:MAG: thioesterase family protein [Alphaproteobacteria bacterium]|uniref:acyl-CoA thioesterase n=1 Tax=Pacificispira sp. TaxID=2888761 RepID=UPI001B196259|nr:thioesterase family protein [Alphaproteobacteria bacterium]MBO6865233.1 thioesterase family protein [Alphaproteobacteria bacterium]MEC9268100.1 thioesterase family protein [Pseudomonadota bacterium]